MATHTRRSVTGGERRRPILYSIPSPSKSALQRRVQPPTARLERRSSHRNTRAGSSDFFVPSPQKAAEQPAMTAQQLAENHQPHTRILTYGQDKRLRPAQERYMLSQRSSIKRYCTQVNGRLRRAGIFCTVAIPLWLHSTPKEGTTCNQEY